MNCWFAFIDLDFLSGFNSNNLSNIDQVVIGLNIFRLNSIKLINWISISGYNNEPPLCKFVFFKFYFGKLLYLTSFLNQSLKVEFGIENLLHASFLECSFVILIIFNFDSIACKRVPDLLFKGFFASSSKSLSDSTSFKIIRLSSSFSSGDSIFIFK